MQDASLHNLSKISLVASVNANLVTAFVFYDDKIPATTFPRESHALTLKSNGTIGTMTIIVSGTIGEIHAQAFSFKLDKDALSYKIANRGMSAPKHRCKSNAHFE